MHLKRGLVFFIFLLALPIVNSNLDLVQNCNYCGCQDGFACESSGQCTKIIPPRVDRTPRKGGQQEI